MISVEKITKIFENGTDVLYANKEVSVKFDKGMTAIVGKSGSGKTTLLNIIGGLLTPTSGVVKINDVDITSLKSDNKAEFRNKQIGFVFQAFYLEDSYTVLENVELPLLISGVKKEERKKIVIEELKIVDMEEKLNVKAINLSGGEKQRVAIARAVINKPKIILCDEPTGNLDSINSKIVMDYLRKLADDGMIVILVTHTMEYAKYADKVLNMVDGILNND